MDVTTSLISQKDVELNVVRAAPTAAEVKASVDVDAARAECKAITEAEMAVVRAEDDVAIAAA